MITIDTINFTPFPAFVGGLLIGIAVIIFFISTGRLAGVSGIANNALTKTKNRSSNLLFLLGLVLGPFSYTFVTNKEILFSVTNSLPLIVFGGLLVGIGTKIGNGCTSGHGICGISRFSIRSIVATIVFMLMAMLSVFLIKFLGIS